MLTSNGWWRPKCCSSRPTLPGRRIYEDTWVGENDLQQTWNGGPWAAMHLATSASAPPDSLQFFSSFMRGSDLGYLHFAGTKDLPSCWHRCSPLSDLWRPSPSVGGVSGDILHHERRSNLSENHPAVKRHETTRHRIVNHPGQLVWFPRCAAILTCASNRPSLDLDIRHARKIVKHLTNRRPPTPSRKVPGAPPGPTNSASPR